MDQIVVGIACAFVGVILGSGLGWLQNKVERAKFPWTELRELRSRVETLEFTARQELALRANMAAELNRLRKRA